MPAAIPLAIMAGGAIAGVAGAKIQSNSAKNAANAQVTAANKSAELQAQSAREALAFQKEEATRDQQNSNNTQLANYGQYADRQNRIGQLGPLLGMSARTAPPPPSYLTGGQSAQGAPAGGADPKLQAAIAAYQQANPGNVAIEPLTAALKQQGFNVDRFKYDGGVLSNNELNVGGQKYKVLGGEGTKAAYWYVPGMDDSAPGAARGSRPAVMPLSTLLSPQAAYSPLTPALTMPRVNPFGV